MAITKTPAFMTTDLTTYVTLELAQRAEFLVLLTHANGVTTEQANAVLDVLFADLDEVKNILRATGRKTRKLKDNSKTSKRRAATAAKAE